MRSIKQILTRLTRPASPYSRSDAPRGRRFIASSERSDLNPTRWMFQEDFQSGIMPFRVDSSADSEIRIQLEGKKKHAGQALNLLGSIRGERLSDEPKVILEAVQRIGELLLWRGLTAFEIVRDTEDNDQLYLYELHFKSLLRLPWNRVQLYSSSGRGFGGLRAVRLPSKGVFEVRMPRALGGVRGYRRLMRRLEGIPIANPEYLLREPYTSKAWKQFDLDTYRRLHDTLVATLTKRWGWHMRDYELSRQTEFYFLHRILTMLWAKAVLRDHIFGELNQLLTRVGYETAISVSGLPTPREIRAHQRRLVTGDLKFAEVHALNQI